MGSAFEHILVAYDGSPPAGVALRCANALAIHGARLVVAAVVDTLAVAIPEMSFIGNSEEAALSALRHENESDLDAARAACLAAGVDPSVRLEQGRPVAELITLAGRIGADLIVTGTHGRKGIERALLGSTAEGILRASSLPVMVVREETNVLAIDKPVARVLVAVDNSGPADAALAVAAKLQRAYGTELILCSIADTRDLQDKSLLYGYDPLPMTASMRDDAEKTIASALRRAGLPENSAQIVIAEGEPAAAIIKAATFHHADAIVVGTHGRRGIERFFLGSVAESVARTSPFPVIVVRG